MILLLFQGTSDTAAISLVEDRVEWWSGNNGNSGRRMCFRWCILATDVVPQLGSTPALDFSVRIIDE